VIARRRQERAHVGAGICQVDVDVRDTVNTPRVGLEARAVGAAL
jgi:hypothetical protein